MIRWLTSGESHGECLAATIEGLPAGVPIESKAIQIALSRRRLGFGRGARMKFEEDAIKVISGVRHGKSLGSPVTVLVYNSEWAKWSVVMSSDPVNESDLQGAHDINAEHELARNRKLTRPRPGHADLVGMQKYGFEDARNVLERASARETAARVAVGAVLGAFLKEVCGTEVISHTVQIGSIVAPRRADIPSVEDLESIDASPVRAFEASISEEMVAEIKRTKKRGDTLGGVSEVLAINVPVGLGSYVHWDRRLDSRLAGALMSIQAMKGVEVGDGFATAGMDGSEAHDEMSRESGRVRRESGHSGGIEGGVSTGETIRTRVAMKPISTVPRALKTFDTDSGEAATAVHQRSDVCSVPAAGVVAEAMVRSVLAQAVLEKFGGDSVAETKRNYESFRCEMPELLR